VIHPIVQVPDFSHIQSFFDTYGQDSELFLHIDYENMEKILISQEINPSLSQSIGYFSVSGGKIQLIPTQQQIYMQHEWDCVSKIDKSELQITE